MKLIKASLADQIAWYVKVKLSGEVKKLFNNLSRQLTTAPNSNAYNSSLWESGGNVNIVILYVPVKITNKRKSLS